MGVADMTRMCGLSPFAASVARCATPKRCCSSVTTSPSRLKSTSSWMSACVPTASCTEPSASAALTARFSAAVMEPVKRAVRTFVPAKKFSKVRRCCSASTSVGAMTADCKPFAAAVYTSAAATAVLPEPTSPCKRRFIGSPERISATASRTARLCAFVMVKGRCAAKSCVSSRVTTQPVVCVCARVFICKSPSCSRNSSSKISRLRAVSSVLPSDGKWMPRMASSSVQSPFCVRTSSGRKSGIGASSESSAFCTQRLIVLEGSAALDG